VRRPARALGALACLGLLTGLLGACGDDLNTDTAPVEVELGEAFSWNSFAVEDGWEITPIERSVGAEEVTTPEVTGTITNRSQDERAALFEMVFSADGSPIATLSCSAATMVEDQSQQFVCPGLSATLPEDYDAVVVQEFRRDTTPS